MGARSRQLWIICKLLHVLPNDDKLKELTQLQIDWIIENYMLDLKVQQQAYEKASGRVVTEEFESDPEQFQEVVKWMREQPAYVEENK